MSEKLQKVLARMGLGSRRGIEKLILQGRVSVNERPAVIGQRVESGVRIRIDGRPVRDPFSAVPPCRVLMYHKPEGELTTHADPENRPTVFDHLPRPESGRWIYIGRLDINSSGLLLFTTDGELANALMHPRGGIERVYATRVYGEVSAEQLQWLLEGVMLEDGPAHFEKIEFAGGEGRNSWYRVYLREGRRREVRRLWEAAGVTVSRLIRIRYAGIELDPRLKQGEFRELEPREVNLLRKQAALSPLPPAALQTRAVRPPAGRHQAPAAYPELSRRRGAFTHARASSRSPGSRRRAQALSGRPGAYGQAQMQNGTRRRGSAGQVQALSGRPGAYRQAEAGAGRRGVSGQAQALSGRPGTYRHTEAGAGRRGSSGQTPASFRSRRASGQAGSRSRGGAARERGSRVRRGF